MASSAPAIDLAMSGLTVAWTALAALFLLTAGYLRCRVHGHTRELRTWQWAVFFHLGAVMFLIIMASHFVAPAPVLVALEVVLIIATALFYLALLVHVCWSELEKYPIPTALRALGRLVRYFSRK